MISYVDDLCVHKKTLIKEGENENDPVRKNNNVA